MSAPKLPPEDQEPWCVAFFAALIGTSSRAADISMGNAATPGARVAARAADIADAALLEIKKRGAKP